MSSEPNISSEADPIKYWVHRAETQGSAAVMWHQNESLRNAAHGTQENLIMRFFPPAGQRGHALDIACGVGRMEPLLSKHFEEVTAFDLDPMIQQAKSFSPRSNVNYVASTIGKFDYGVQKYDFVLLLGALVASIRVSELPEIFNRIKKAMKPGGRLLMLEPFHPKPPLARYCRCHPTTIVDLATDAGFHLIHHSGAHLAVMRKFLTDHPWERLTPILYSLGEVVLSLTSPRRLGDYQVMVFETPYAVVPFLSPDTPSERHAMLREVQGSLEDIRIYDPGDIHLNEVVSRNSNISGKREELSPLALLFNDASLVRAGNTPACQMERLYVPGNAKGMKAWDLIDKRNVWKLANQYLPADVLTEHVAKTITFDHVLTWSEFEREFNGISGIILKPAVKGLHDKFGETYGAKVIRASDNAQAYDLAKSLLSNGFPTVVQEELSLDDQLSVWFYRGQGRFHAIVSRTCGMFPRLGGTAYWTRTIKNDELLELSAKILSLLEFDGIGELEFQRGESGEYKWNLELNPRLWRQWTCALDSGLPLVDFLLMAHYGYPIPQTFERTNAGWFSLDDLRLALRVEKSWWKKSRIVARLLLETETKEWHARQSLLRIMCSFKMIRKVLEAGIKSVIPKQNTKEL